MPGPDRADLAGGAGMTRPAVNRCGEHPAWRDQRRVQFGHASPGAPAQLGPQRIGAEQAGNPPLVMMRAVRLGAACRPDHHDLGMRR